MFRTPVDPMRSVLLTLILLLVACAPAIGGEPAEALARRSAIYRRIAERGHLATVGVYCKVDEHDRYYGTGVIVSPDGYVLTSTTVVPPGATEIEVHTVDHSHRMAEIVEMNEEVETTLLRVDARKVPYLPIAEELPDVGERAYSFGNANNMIRLGEGASFSVGIISGVYDVESADNESSYKGMAIETDASINPGQDGGPLLNSRGQVVGIISLSFSESRWQGTAVPITAIVEKLRAFRRKQVPVSHEPLLTPPPQDTAEGNPFAQQARKLYPTLVRLDIEREHKAEKMPRLNWSEHKRSLENWDTMSQSEKTQVQVQFFGADRLLVANQQIRRPADPATGVLVSPQGHILTSAFNLGQKDPVFLHKENGLMLPSFQGRVSDLLAFDSEQFEVKTNSIERIFAVLHDGRRLPAKVIAVHVPLQVGLLKIEAEGLDHLDLPQRTAAPRTGRQVGIVGAIAGKLPFTLNTGIVSAEARQRGAFFQIDALLNYGNSGGPVISREGEFLGIAGAPMRPTPILGRIIPFDKPENDPACPVLQQWIMAPNSGVGIVASGPRLREALPALMAGKSVLKRSGAFLGVAPDAQRAFGKDVLIGHVQEGTPAAEAGLRAGDIITRIDDRPIHAWKQVFAIIDDHDPGDTVTITIRRAPAEEGGEAQNLSLTVTLGERP